MKKHWILAGLMGATVLTGIGPTAASAAEQDRAERRWNDRRTVAPRSEADAPVRQRTEIRGDWPQNRMPPRAQRAEAVRETRQDRVEAAREARRERVEPVREIRRDWRQNAREERRDDLRERRQDVRQDARRDWQNDRDRREIRRDWRDNSHGDYREAGRRYSWDRDWRRDQRYDWQRYRQTHRHVYRGPHYYAPRGWDYGYRRFSIGIALWSGLYADRYWIGDPGYYRLPPAYGPLRWVRYYDDALLVDIRSGYVVDVIHDFFW